MDSVAPNSSPWAIPRGYRPIAICPEESAAALRLCVLVKEQADPVGGHLVLLQEQMDAKRYLGCVVDAHDRVHQWVEIWIQDLSGLSGSLLAFQENLSNARLDERWGDYIKAMESVESGGLIRVGGETVHPAPVFLDIQGGKAFTPRDGQANWSLCQDDSLLARKGLPPYSSSLHRYLCLSSMGDQSPFIPVSPDAPANAATRPLSDLLAKNPGAVPLNSGGGLMLVRRHYPIGIEALVDVLGGSSWEGISHGRGVIDAGGLLARLKNQSPRVAGNGRVFDSPRDPAARLTETLYLKLRLLMDAIQAVQTAVSQLGRPFLGLNAESFAVCFSEPACALPFLWTARAVLSNPGTAIAVGIPGSDTSYFLPSASQTPPIYRPPVNAYAFGVGSARIPRIHADPSGCAILEITFATQAHAELARSDLVHLRLHLGDSPVNLYAQRDVEAPLAPGEWRLRTIQQRFPEPVLARIRAAEGSEMRGVRFELIPLLSTPCDLYALAVFAVRVLLTNPTMTHAVALDRILSLARQAAAAAGDLSQPLSDRIGKIFGQDARWIEQLGPQRLIREPLAPVEAFALFPRRLWFDVLAMIVRMFPGVGPDSVCRDFGDAPPGGLHRVFETSLADLESLLLRVRSLIVVDWRLNHEIQAVIDKCLAAMR